MTETFVRIASISGIVDILFHDGDPLIHFSICIEMESKLSSAKKDGTLWETEEQALRYVNASIYAAIFSSFETILNDEYS